MTNEELKKKIISALQSVEFVTEKGWCGQCISLRLDYSAIADALIAAGLCDKNTLDERYQTLMAAGFVQLASLRLDLEKVLHRAEVAERALDKAVELAYEYRTEADTLSCSSCPMGDELFPKCKDRGLYKECSKRWKEQLIEQAERELAEEGKDE